MMACLCLRPVPTCPEERGVRLEQLSTVFLIFLTLSIYNHTLCW